MDLVLASFGDGELEKLPKFKRLLEKLGEKLDSDGRLKSKAEASAKLEREAMAARQDFLEQLILFRCLQALAVRDVDGENGQLPEEHRMVLSDLLASSEWNTLRKTLPNKAICLDDLHSGAKPPEDFDKVLAQGVASKLEDMVSKLVELSGESDKKGLEKRLQRIEASNNEIATLERSRYKLVVAYQMALHDYLQKLSAFCEEFIYTGDLQLHDAGVDWLLMKADALMLKASTVELQIQNTYYTRERVEKLKVHRNEQIQLREKLVGQIDTAKDQLKAYESIAGPDFSQVVKEYGRVQDEIERHKWILQEMVSNDESPM